MAKSVGVVDGVIGGTDRVMSLAALFPQAQFVSAGPIWPERAPPCDVLIAPVDALSAQDVDGAVRRLKARGQVQVIVVLKNADVMTTRRLAHEGAADVLSAPVSEPTLALSLERIFASSAHGGGDRGPTGEIVAFLKAGGGVGATVIATQLAAMLAQRSGASVCLADLDVQFGAASLYLDLPEALTLGDFLASGQPLEETPFEAALARHHSGARVLAAPRDLTPLEILAPQHIDALFAALRRDFALTLVDLPSVWTAWSNRALQLADRIVLVTQLTVPHVNFVRRQIRALASQGLDGVPLILVCNGLSADQQAGLSVKAAEKAIGRTFDAVLPEDRKVVNAAINQGVELAQVKRGTKLEKAIGELGVKVAASALTLARSGR
ncbi:MAG TPA: hypothetical protein VG939_03705 [Caulobacteraceae bacterium]|nr:hypothetical protein [Caulobacteraceae bacterium]